MFNPQDILILCCWFKRNLFFEDSIRRLWDCGFKNIWLIETSPESWGSYQGPWFRYLRAPLIQHPHMPTLFSSWSKAITICQKEIKESGINYTHLFLMDFDLFLANTKEFLLTLDEVIRGQYDHVSRLRDAKEATLYQWPSNQYIIPIQETTFTPTSTGSDIFYMQPEYTTGWEVFSRQLWESFSEYELGEWTRIMKAAVERDAKMGAQKSFYGAEIRMNGSTWPVISERAWGKEWFHVARLPLHYTLVETRQFDRLVSDHGPNLFRIGFFAKQEEIYGPGIYPRKIRDDLEATYQHMGGREKCLKEWEIWVRDTPMQDWQAY